ncbi:GGDEF domain-containing protein [Thermomonas fusca]|uniref:GGDEF domain-containing protein n=1 Tax=Thermomonas fusca TaxID=215690 RepID=UPI00048C518D|nr:GGDEF domain-containing protein [Thermomonas fusca]
MAPTPLAQPSQAVSRRRWLGLLASPYPRRRLLLLHWLIACVVYVGTAVLLVAGVDQGWMRFGALLGWSSFVTVVLLSGYAAIRSGWSERFADPALTQWQLSMGVIAVNWGYVICGPMRTAALFPLMVVFDFAAYGLRFRQIGWLTLFTVLCLASAVAIRQWLPAWIDPAQPPSPLQVDLYNLSMIAVVLPAFALVTARLSALRKKLRDQRAQLADALAAVERLAVSDELTGLPNRRAMLETLATNTRHARRGLLPVTIAMVDLDHFKRINDTLGHPAGDAVLVGFAELVRQLLREGDVLGRWGGEEFLLVLPGATAAQAQQVLWRLQAAVRDQLLAGQPVTFSVGVAAHRGSESAETLLSRADAALYEAKHAGRDCVAIASGESQVAADPI